MSRFQVRPFHFDDVGAAALLLAERHQRDRSRLPLLSKTFDSPEECAAVLRHTMQTERAFGVVALAGDRPVGFLLAEKQLHAPTSLAAQFIPPYTLGFPLHGHAVADGHSATEIYRLMYGEVAARGVERGFFAHRAYVIPGDRDTEEAWVNLGFGRALVCAVRDTSPLASVPANGEIEIHQATSEDIDVVMRLEHANMVHHFGSPIFWPYLHETMNAAREYQQALLSDPENAHFVAYRNGEPQGMDTFNPPDWVSPLLQSGRSIYLFQGVVEESARGNGVGKLLLDRSMSWAREQGYEQCILHFASANASGSAFWLSQGFVPVEYAMTRHIDERIGWARP
ncbi:MAG: GNAT family N-acetyltransferase [Dehalococcoidia bacterium]|nr:GNAT family N-acetyltransferase [Dehalococcoidia bacterium]